jgi:hypothetical protein
MEQNIIYGMLILAVINGISYLFLRNKTPIKHSNFKLVEIFNYGPEVLHECEDEECEDKECEDKECEDKECEDKECEDKECKDKECEDEECKDKECEDEECEDEECDVSDNIVNCEKKFDEIEEYNRNYA